ncbi:MAG: CDP-alcohol phosphatidyltransferase family protein [Christensenellales bacterium]
MILGQQEEGHAAYIKQDQIINIPNALTVVRICFCPSLSGGSCRGRDRCADCLSGRVLTDALDGIIARKFNQITALGKLLDPLADNCLW